MREGSVRVIAAAGILAELRRLGWRLRWGLLVVFGTSAAMFGMIRLAHLDAAVRTGRDPRESSRAPLRIKLAY